MATFIPESSKAFYSSTTAWSVYVCSTSATVIVGCLARSTFLGMLLYWEIGVCVVRQPPS